MAIQVNYYGDEDEDNVNWKKEGPELVDLVKLLANYYGQDVVIKTTPAIQKKIDQIYIKQSKFWIEDTKIKKRNQRIQYVEYDADQKLKNDRDTIELPVSYFNGSQKNWNEKTY